MTLGSSSSEPQPIPKYNPVSSQRGTRRVTSELAMPVNASTQTITRAARRVQPLSTFTQIGV